MGVNTEEKKILERLASKVNSKIGSPIVSIKNCNINAISLDFYNKFRLYTLFDTSFTPVVRYQLLDNGYDTILLDGNYECWLEANKIETPNLSLLNILDYLKLTLNSGLNCVARRSIVTSVDDIDFVKMPPIDMFNQIEEAIRPPIVSFNNNTFTILTCIIKGNNLYDCLIYAYQDGSIDIVDKNLILEGIPVDEYALD